MNRTEQLVTEIVQAAHPKMAVAMRMAAIPHWYDVNLFSAIRAEDDGRNEGIVERLIERYSFVLPIPNASVPTYRIRDEERVVFNTRWIQEDPPGYLVAHKHAYDYYQQHGEHAKSSEKIVEYASIIEDYPELYHHFFVDLPAATQELIQIFREFYKWRKVGAIDNLLEMLDEVHEYLHLLPQAAGPDTSGGGNLGPKRPTPDAVAYFDGLRIHYHARGLQLRGKWAESLDAIRDLRFSPSLSEPLAPFVIRSYGISLARTEQYVDGIFHLEEALKRFAKLPEDATDPHRNEIEQAYTMIELGESYVAFARAVRGEVAPEPLNDSLWQRFRNLIAFLFNGPLVIYLSQFLGMRVWLPSFWPTLGNLDWVVARLFAKAVDFYERADDILEARQTAVDEHLIADEKLGFLYFSMGDVPQAKLHFRQMLDNPYADLTEIGRATVNLGLAWTLVQSNQNDLAISILESNLTTLEETEDEQIIANANALLAQAYMAAGRTDESIARFSDTLEHYTAHGQVVQATNLVESLEQQLDEAQSSGATWATATRQKLIDASASLEERVYGIGYKHPLLTSFRQLVALLVPAALVVGLLLSFNLDTQLSLSPDLSINVPPLLDPTDSISSKITQSVSATELRFAFEPSVGLLGSTLFVAGFFLLSLLFGLAAIAFTPLRLLQRQQEKEIVIGPQGIKVRLPERSSIDVAWENVSQYISANVKVWDRPMPEHSGTALCSQDGSLLIPGSTNHYDRITERIRSRFDVPGSQLPLIPEKDVGYSIFRSRLGLIYGLNLLLLGVMLLLTKWDANGLLWSDIPGTPYSLVDLYPYLYIPAVLIPIAWAVLTPLLILLYTGRRSRLPGIVMGTGLVITLILVLTLFMPLFTVPDLYPALITVPSMAIATYVLWNLKDGQALVYPLWLRVSSVLVTLLVTILLVGVLQRDVRAYHYLIIGNTSRDEERYTEAIENYQMATDIGRQTVWWFFNPVKAFMPNRWPHFFNHKPGIPGPENMTWFIAQKNLAALQSQEDRHEEAIANYSALVDVLCWPENQPDDNLVDVTKNEVSSKSLTCLEGEEKFLAWRAMARARMLTDVTSDEGRVEVQQVLADYDQAIELNPQKSEYYLWKGFTSQALNEYGQARIAYETALELSTDPTFQLRVKTFQGWLALEQQSYTEATQLFSSVIETATETDSATSRSNFSDAPSQETSALQGIEPSALSTIVADAERGLGYASYEWAKRGSNMGDDRQLLTNDGKLALYEQAQSALEDVIERNGESGELLKSLATIHWAKAQLTADQCAEWETATSLYEQSLQFDTTDEERAFTYRSIAQLQYVLGNLCEAEGYDKESQYRAAINRYTEAISQVDSTYRLYAYYVHQRARISHELWLALPNTTIEEQAAKYALLLSELVDLRTALEIDGVDKNIVRDGQTSSATPFDYQPNVFARVAIQRALDEIKRAIGEGNEAKREEIWAALEPLIPHVDGADLVLVGQSIINQDIASSQQSAIADLLSQGMALLDADNPLILLKDAHQAYQQQNWDEAVEIYQTREAQLNDVDLAKVSTPGARQLAGLALRAGDIERAAYWYSLLMVRVSTTEYEIYRGARSDLWPIWQTTGSQAEAFLPALEVAFAQTLNLDSSKEKSGYYWSLRAWFKYAVGLNSFRLEDEESARLALDLAQPDADKAFALGYVGVNDVYTYLSEGAWGWYHITRGNDAFSEEAYDKALANYSAAYTAFQPKQNQTAQAEQVEAALNAGLTALILGETREARNWYSQGLELAATFDENPELPGKLAAAVTALNEQSLYGSAARTLKTQLLAKLQE